MIWKLAVKNKCGGQETNATVKRQLRRSTAAVAFDRRLFLLTAAVVFLTASLSAQTADSLTIRFSGMTAVTGYEQAFSDSLLSLLPGSTRDRTGNVTLTLGRGAPRRLVYCAL